MLEESKTAIFLAGLSGKLRSIMGNLIKNSRIAASSSDIKRGFFDKPVKMVSVFLFTAVSVNILSIAVFRREADLLDMVVKAAVLLLSLGGFFCNANWKDVKKSSFILNKIFK